MSPDVGPRCPACRMGLVTHEPKDPHCLEYEKEKPVNISDEAVEAAWATFWDVPHVPTSNVTKREVRAALEAAAPHLMAQALLDTVSVIEDLPGTEHDAPAKGNYSAFSTFPEAWLRGRAEAYRSAGAGE